METVNQELVSSNSKKTKQLYRMLWRSHFCDSFCLKISEHESLKNASLNVIIPSAQQLHLAYPVLVTPPSQKSIHWSIKSNAQIRRLRSDAYFDAHTGELVNQHSFSQRHIIDRAVGIGIAAHEGQLFGWFNQLLGLLTALGLVFMSIAGFIMWRKPAPKGARILGAPPAMPDAKIGFGFVAIIVIAAILLPLLGASLIIIVAFEKLVLPRWKRAQLWLGAM